MGSFTPDYNNVLDAARNKEAKRIPLYEHLVSVDRMETILNRQFSGLIQGSYRDKVEFFKNYCEFYREMGYDTVSVEECIGPVMPGSGCLGGHKEPAVRDREDFERYPWEEVPELYFKRNTEIFQALREAMPEGMKAVGGVGNGIFECVQEITGYMNLCYIMSDDPELFDDLFKKVGQTNLLIWERFMKEFNDIYCVLRFGDDMGYKCGPLLPPDVIRKNIIPQYKSIIKIVHSYNKPFLLHSCGHIFNVMEDLIACGIDAKHSNEDQIADFSTWVDKYGERIGNFGGIDTDHLCRKSREEIKEITLHAINCKKGRGGYAIGSGNSIPDYVPVEGYMAMVETVRIARGE